MFEITAVIPISVEALALEGSGSSSAPPRTQSILATGTMESEDDLLTGPPIWNVVWWGIRKFFRRCSTMTEQAPRAAMTRRPGVQSYIEPAVR